MTIFIGLCVRVAKTFIWRGCSSSFSMPMPVNKLRLTGRNIGRALKSRNVCLIIMHLFCRKSKLSNLKLTARHKQLFVSLPLDIALPPPLLYS